MKVAIVSDFLGYKPALEESYLRAFEALGHTAHRVSLFDILMKGSPRGLVADFACAFARQKALCQAVTQTDAELVVLVKGVGVFAKSVRAWRKQGRKVVNVFPDDAFEGIHATLTSRLLLDQFRCLDRLFVHDRFVIPKLCRLGIRAEFTAFARDPALHDPAFAGDRLSDQPDIVFIGNPDDERIRYLKAISDLDLGVWGNWRWADLSASDPLRACIRGESLVGEGFVNRMRHAKVVINVLRVSQKTAHNMRTFDSPACGACTLSEASNGVGELLREGEEVVTFRTPDDLRRQCEALLADAERRKAIAEGGWRRVKEDTYARRVASMVASLTTR